MEGEKKGIRCSYGLLIIILFATVCFLTDYIVIDRKLREDKTIIYDDPVSKEDSIKIDSSKDYVYDASYDFDFLKDSYYANGRLINKSDIVVPYININSDAAKAANEEIAKLYNDLGETYNDATEREIFYRVSKYDAYVVDNIVSVIITVTAGGTDVPIDYYYTYNFSLKDGHLLSYSDVFTAAGIDFNNISSRVQKTVTAVMTDKFGGFTESNYYGDTSFDTYNNESYKNYVVSVNNGTIKYFIDSNKKLNVVVTLSIPAGRGEFDTIITVEKKDN
jgi:hypothetical protein